MKPIGTLMMLGIVAGAGFLGGRWTAPKPQVKSLASVLKDPIDVRDFGAKCDGETDDTIALCNAREVAERSGVLLVQPMDFEHGRYCHRPHGIGNEACARARAAQP